MRPPEGNISLFDMLLVDGYNIIHSWNYLSKLAASSLEMARDKLIARLANYQGYRHIPITIVFDAHRMPQGETIIKTNIEVIYTAEKETADSYIERAATALARSPDKLRLAVATSDADEQVIVMGKGALRLTPRELLQDVIKAEESIRRRIKIERPVKNNQLLDNLDSATAKLLEQMRQNKDL